MMGKRIVFLAMFAAYHAAMFEKCFEAIFHFELIN
jgi:hypothetical protein